MYTTDSYDKWKKQIMYRYIYKPVEWVFVLIISCKNNIYMYVMTFSDRDRL